MKRKRRKSEAARNPKEGQEQHIRHGVAQLLHNRQLELEAHTTPEFSAGIQ